jgi:hypothetical protein
MSMKRLPLIGLFVANLALFAQSDAGAITGRVLGMNGRPAAGVRVALASPDANGKITSDILAGLTVTDETGHYRIENIPPGRYGIVAGAVAAPTFYPGTVNSSGASLLTIQRGATTSGLDFALATPTAPIPGAQNTFGPPFQAQTIALLNQQLALPGQVFVGRVVVDGPVISSFLPNLKVTFSRMAGTSAATATPSAVVKTAGVMYSVSTSVKLDGSFRLELKPMPYRISVARADDKRLEGFLVKSITRGTTDLLKEELKADGPVTGEIVITLLPIPMAGPIKL